MLTSRQGGWAVPVLIATLGTSALAERTSTHGGVVLRDVSGSLAAYARGNYDESITELTHGRKIADFSAEFRREADRWVAAASVVERPARVRVVGAVVVELMAVSFSRDVFEYDKARGLLEWICEKVRQHPPSEAERWFHLASIALLQGAQDETLISGQNRNDLLPNPPVGSSHVLHAGRRFPDESRFKLAYLTTRTELQYLAAWPLPSSYIIRVSGRFDIALASDAAEIANTLDVLSQLSSDPAVGSEALLRSGALRLLIADTGAAQDLKRAVRSADPSVQYVAHLLLGTIAERAGRLNEALTAFQSAHATVPATTSSIAVAGTLFRMGRQSEAADLLEEFNKTSPRPDPWRLYAQRDYRFFEAYREQLRRAVLQ